MTNTADLFQPVRGGISVAGSLEVEAVAESGRTGLGHLYHSVPFHVSKPYWDGSVLLVQVASPTAGIFSGDRLSSRVEVGEKAALLITNQGASRIHPRGEQGNAQLDQEFRVSSGGWLEVFPELVIPHRGAGLVQKTTVEVARGGRAYYAEILAPGRTASGESYAYQLLDWRFRLSHDQIPLVIERAEITPETIPWMFARPPRWEQLYYACVWMVAPELASVTDLNLEAIHCLRCEDVQVGISRINEEVMVIKIIASGSIPLRRTLRDIRVLMGARLPLLRTDPRKL